MRLRSLINIEYSTFVRQGVKFAITGGSGLVANLALLSLLVELTSFPEEYAAIISTGIVLIGSFLLTDYWVFSNIGNDATTTKQRGVGYFTVMIAGKMANYALYLLFLSLGISYQAAWLIGSIFVFSLTFSTNHLLWREKF